MLILEIILALLLLGFASSRCKDGLIFTLGRLIAVAAGFIVAKLWFANVQFIFAWVLPANWAGLAAFIAIFGAVDRAVLFIYGFIESVLNIIAGLPLIKTLNKWLGAILGLVEGAIVLGALSWVMVNFNLWPKITPLLLQSQVLKYVNQAMEFVFSFVF
jgi:uncharacterized membrane protein required for colicin V production